MGRPALPAMPVRS